DLKIRKKIINVLFNKNIIITGENDIIIYDRDMVKIGKIFSINRLGIPLTEYFPQSLEDLWDGMKEEKRLDLLNSIAERELITFTQARESVSKKWDDLPLTIRFMIVAIEKDIID
ncbi:unnamed protein product, partial [marine sediment metagenome]